MKVVVTGSAGFIGFHLSKKLLEAGHSVVGIDNHNDYYDIGLKEKRTSILTSYVSYSHFRSDIANHEFLNHIFDQERPNVVVNLAAQAGVRHSIEHPEQYTLSNLVGFANVLEACRRVNVSHLIFASSSSVYGNSEDFPLQVQGRTDAPLSYYAATKKSNEVMAFSYSSLFGLRTTGLRFFTVYGPWGRPDMAMYKFAKAIQSGAEIELYNSGNHVRDFTYIDDAVSVMHKTVEQTRTQSQDASNGNSGRQSNIYNIASGVPIDLWTVVKILEKKLGTAANIRFGPMKPGDVEKTHGDIQKTQMHLDYKVNFDIEEGIENFVHWFLEHQQMKKG